MGSMSIGHWLIVLVVVAIVFGPKRLGNFGKGLGEGVRGLKDGLAGRGEDDAPSVNTRPGQSAEARSQES